MPELSPSTAKFLRADGSIPAEAVSGVRRENAVAAVTVVDRNDLRDDDDDASSLLFICSAEILFLEKV